MSAGRRRVATLNGMDDVTEAYSRRAAEYTDLLGSMSSVHASDRQLIDSWLETLTGPVLDAGCGPGHWTDHIASRGFAVRGIDRVPAFLEHARSSYPGVSFGLGSIDRIEEPDGSIGGVLSWYSTIHHPPARIAEPIGEFARVLRPGGDWCSATSTDRPSSASTTPSRPPTAGRRASWRSSS